MGLINKHLIFREWLLHKVLLVAAVVVLGFGLNWYTLLWLATDGLVADFPVPPGFTPATYWAHDLYGKLMYMQGYLAYSGYPGLGTIVVVALLGLLQVAGERAGRNLEHLLALPVTRKEVAVSKLAAGAATITVGMALGALLTGSLVALLPAPPDLTVALVARSYLQWWLLLLGIYAVAFVAGLVAGNWQASVLTCLALEVAPFCLAVALYLILVTLGVDEASPVLEHLWQGGEALTPVILLQHAFDWKIVAVLPLALFALVAVSAVIFEVSPFEQTGEFFALGNSSLLLGAALGSIAAVVADWGFYQVVLGGRPVPGLSLLVLGGVFAAVLWGTQVLARRRAYG